ncbi:tripartite tricarboxylate transporter TctB family protein [Azospirillum halopraeferens]|uniref:tripartite tricarboxylate transporter TctB family protein n=1 Tax=Azospirillum halopraeferens TaxID=34010 RepID=UPI00041D519B|nr:tripartite tricarboxylate transporter TctB family protein [Azospirillum halopraeferens]
MRIPPLRTLNLPEITAAAVVLLFGLFMVGVGLTYPFGSIQRMGPGFFPVVLGVALCGLGAVLLVQALAASRATIPFAPRPILFMALPVLLFALLAPRIGLVPTTLLLVMVSARAERPAHLRSAVITAVAMAILGDQLFIRALGVSLPAFWW